jgi:hypothetical protein
VQVRCASSACQSGNAAASGARSPDEAAGGAPQDSAGFDGEMPPTLGEELDVLPGSAAALDPVEDALARALTEASAAGRFDVVAQLAGELQARRLAREGVPTLLSKSRRGVTSGS